MDKTQGFFFFFSVIPGISTSTPQLSSTYNRCGLIFPPFTGISGKFPLYVGTAPMAENGILCRIRPKPGLTNMSSACFHCS